MRRTSLVLVTAAALAMSACAGGSAPADSLAVARTPSAVATVTDTPLPTYTPKATATPKVEARAATGPTTPPTTPPAKPATKKIPAVRSKAKPLAGKVIVIDPGHNGGNFSHPQQIRKLVDAGFGLKKACNSTGTATNKGYSEAAYTFSVATRLTKLLRAEGAKVVLTRSTNKGVGPCINKRAKIGNDAKADAVLSIHGDGNLAKGARGFHVIIAKRMMGGTKIQKRSQHLADLVRKDFRAGTGMPFSTYTGGGKAETHRTDIGGLNLSTRPAVMIETGNMRSATDAKLMSSVAFRQKEAKALAAGLTLFLH